jgi:hypothetical protein
MIKPKEKEKPKVGIFVFPPFCGFQAYNLYMASVSASYTFVISERTKIII